jgi:hypothetical protein
MIDMKWATFSWITAKALWACLVFMVCPVLAQTVGPSTPAPAAPSTAERQETSQWKGLNQRQQQALAPLASAWPQLTPNQRQKWLALAQTYDSLTPSEKTTVHQRMAEWAALSVHERARARMNYSHLKSLSREELKAQWEAYQALSEDEKKRLQQQRPAPKSAAPVSGPLTAKTDRLVQPPARQGMPAASSALDRKTLLPRNTEAAPSVAQASAPVTESAAASDSASE